MRAAGLTVEQAAEASTAISALPTVNLAGVACVVSCTEPCFVHSGLFQHEFCRGRWVCKATSWRRVVRWLLRHDKF